MAFFRIPSSGLWDDWSPVMSDPQGVMVINPFRGLDWHSRQKPQKPAAWTQTTNMPELYEPEDITMKVEGDKVLIHGIHTYGDQDKGMDKIESNRSVNIPEDVDPSTVKLVWVKGTLYVKGQWKKSEEKEIPAEEGRDIPITLKKGGQVVQVQKQPLKLDLNLSHYKPEEIRVRMSGDKLVVTAEQQVEDDSHFHAQQFSRVIRVPDFIDTGSLNSHLGDDGILHISAPVLPQIEGATDAPGAKDEQPMEAEHGGK